MASMKIMGDLIMVKCTSKASYREEKENGNVVRQADKILLLCREASLSLQEIMKLYRKLYGNIELSSVSARVNKLKEEGKLTEADPRKCTITNKIINPVTAIKCKHERYKQGNHLTYENALKAMRARDGKGIYWMGMIVKGCEDCGMDLSEHKVVPVKYIRDYNLLG